MVAKIYKSFFLLFLFTYFLGGSAVFCGNNDLFRVNVFFDKATQLLEEIGGVPVLDVTVSEKEQKEQDIDFSSVLDFSNTTLSYDQKLDNQDLLEHIDFSQDSSVENYIEKKEEGQDQDFRRSILYKKLKFLLSKFYFYKFNCRCINSFKLSILFKEIDEGQNNFLSNKDKFLLTQENIEKINAVFDLLRKGIACELCFDHLLNFRENLIYQLKELFFLIDYWNIEYQNNSFLEKMKKSFSTPDIDVLEIRLKELSFVKDRVACYLGKIDEIFLHFFEIINSYEDFKDDDYERICHNLTIFISQSVFCLDSFFMQNFDPDRKIYNEKFKSFEELPIMESVKLLCKNHSNIGLMDDFFEVQVSDYQIPSFLSRHWLLMSVCGTAVIGMSDEPNSPKNQVINAGHKAVNIVWEDGFVRLWEMFKEKFLLGDTTKEKNKILEVADKIEKKIESFSKVSDGLKASLKDKDLLSKDSSEKGDLFEAINKAGIILGNKHAEFNKYKEAFEGHLNKGLAQSAPGGIAGKVILGEERIKEVDHIILLIKDIKEIIKTLLNQVGNGSNYLQTHEVLLVDSVTDVLTLVDTLLPMINNMERTGRATYRWMTALLVTVVIPTITFLIIRKIIRLRRMERYGKVNLIISEVYRVLICYKSDVSDYYHNGLKYRDQGLIGFWAEKLNAKVETVCRDDKNKLLKLIGDLQNPNLSVNQKVEFIKLEWGKNLFGNEAIA